MDADMNEKDVRPVQARSDTSRTNTDNALPKMGTGAVCVQWTRCGRASCRCTRGALHGPYHYLFWREGGRLRKRYIPALQVPAVAAACADRRRREANRCDAVRTAQTLWRALRALVREVEGDARG